MSAYDHGQLPDDLAEIGERLRAERPAVSAIELDRIKQVAMAKASRPAASRSAGGRRAWQSLVGILVAGSLLIGGTGGVLAAMGGGGDAGSAAEAQYCPPGSPPDCGDLGPGGAGGGDDGDNGAQASAGAGGGTDDGLPFTGLAVGGLALVAGLALGVGLVVRRIADRAT